MTIDKIDEVEAERDLIAIALLRRDDPVLIRVSQSFLFEMRAKLGRAHAAGRTGWAIEDDEDWSIDEIKRLLISNVERGDPVDVANFALFWWYHKRRIERDSVIAVTPERREEDRMDDLDWSDAKKHLDEMKNRYAELLNTPGVDPSYALGGIMETERRFDKGERTQSLFDAMMEIE